MIQLFSYIIIVGLALFNFSILSLGSAALCILLLFLGSREKSILNPYYIFFPAAFSPIIYVQTFSQNILIEIPLYVQFLIILGNTSFLVGLLMLSKQKKQAIKMNTLDPFWLILIIGLTPHIIGLLTVGIPILSDLHRDERSQYVIPVIGQLIIFLPVCILIAFKRKDIFLIGLSCLLNIVLSFFVGSKSLIFLTMFFIIYGILSQQKKTTFLSTGLVLIFLIIFTPFIFVFTAYSSNDLYIIYYWESQVDFGNSLIESLGNGVTLPYLYATTSWSNFTWAIESEMPYTLGARSFYSFSSVFQFDSYLAEPPIYSFPFNTHAYLTDYYLDFGPIGIIIFPFLMGMLLKHAYLLKCSSDDIFDKAIYIFLAYPALLLFFSNHYTEQSYPLVAFILLNIFKQFFRKPKYRV